MRICDKDNPCVVIVAARHARLPRVEWRGCYTRVTRDSCRMLHSNVAAHVSAYHGISHSILSSASVSVAMASTRTWKKYQLMIWSGRFASSAVWGEGLKSSRWVGSCWVPHFNVSGIMASKTRTYRACRCRLQWEFSFSLFPGVFLVVLFITDCIFLIVVVASHAFAHTLIRLRGITLRWEDASLFTQFRQSSAKITRKSSTWQQHKGLSLQAHSHRSSDGRRIACRGGW